MIKAHYRRKTLRFKKSQHLTPKTSHLNYKQMKKTILFILFIYFHVQTVFSQIGIGQWRDHLPYNQAKIVVDAGDKIFCASSLALFYYNKNDGSIGKLSKVNGLSDIKPSALAYYKSEEILIVAYQNANIDLISKNTIINIDDIKNKNIQGDKKIYDINIHNGLAYLSLGFGIVVLDINKKEIKDTYYIGENAEALLVYGTAIADGKIYAATENGVYYANLSSSQLINYKEWTKLSSSVLPSGRYSSIAAIGSQILVNFEDKNSSTSVIYKYSNNVWREVFSFADFVKRIKASGEKLFIITKKNIIVLNSNLTIDTKITDYGFAKSQPNDCVETHDGQLFIADGASGLVVASGGGFKQYWVNSPLYNYVADIQANGDKIYVAGGGRNAYWSNLWRYAQIYEFNNETWTSNVLWDSDLRDFVKVVINPYNPAQIYAASWGGGLAMFENNKLVATYNDKNSTLQSAILGQMYINIGGIAIDNSQNVYVTNAFVKSPISVKTAAGKWYCYDYQEISGYERIGNIINTQYGHKWVQLGRNGGIFAFDDNKTFGDTQDDKRRLFSLFDVNGDVETNEVLSMAEDQDGVVWVGTNQGVLTYFNPQNVFSGKNFYADRIKVVDNYNDTLAHYLLAKERITAIAIDGANRKWFGTETSGVFLMSEDGKDEIFHFTTDNSKLISNSIISIAVQENTGEVFFGTNEGIVSFKGSSTKGKDNYADAYVYPNPVRENFSGNITITGLVKNANVKITDIAGRLVYETTAFGGQAIWNGKNYSGKRVNTGVYLIFCTDEMGEKTKVLKLLVIN